MQLVMKKEIAEAFRAEKRLGTKFRAGVELSRVDREKYHVETRQAGRAMLACNDWAGHSEDVCQWLIAQYQEGALEDISTVLRRQENRYVTEPVLRNAIDVFAEAARPAVVAALENPNAALRLVAIEQLVKWDRGADHELILEQFRRNLAIDDPKTIVAFVALPASFSALVIWHCGEQVPCRHAATDLSADVVGRLSTGMSDRHRSGPGRDGARLGNGRDGIRSRGPLASGATGGRDHASLERIVLC